MYGTLLEHVSPSNQDPSLLPSKSSSNFNLLICANYPNVCYWSKGQWKDTSGIFSCKTFFYYIFYVNGLVLPEKWL